MIIDCHTHLFPPGIIASVASKNELVELLRLEVEPAERRTTAAQLLQEATGAGVDRCVLLPVAPADGVVQVNRATQAIAASHDGLVPAASLHPGFPGNREELQRLRGLGTRVLKLCTFSQQFRLEGPEAARLMELIQEENRQGGSFVVLLDTFVQASRFFETRDGYLTTPARLGQLARRYPGVPVIGAHMGGLTAPIQELLDHLVPLENLYLDTSNASHVLTEEEFLTLVARHGPGHILFGTDWPWFGPAAELARIDGLLERGGYHAMERARVLGGNAARLLGLAPGGVS